MRQLTMEQVEKVAGAGFCEGFLATTFTGVGLLLGAGAGVGVASAEGAWAGAELGYAAGAYVASGIC